MFIKFPSIEQLKNITAHVKRSAEWHAVPKPTIKFFGSTKCHGTNGGVTLPVNATDATNIEAQSRENPLTVEKDNFGFAAFVHKNNERFFTLMQRAKALRPEATGYIQFFGEWMGTGIQKKVGVSNLPKTFYLFAIRISEDAESQDWFSPEEIAMVFAPDAYETREIDRIYAKTDFPCFYVDIDFNDVASMQNHLIDLTIAVEEDCPVTRKLIPEDDICRVGEGIVWEAVASSTDAFPFTGMLLKIKGEKHSKGAHVKVLLPVDEVKLANVKEFVEFACTEGRMQQGMFVLKERGIDVSDTHNTGEFIKWVCQDILKEEVGALTNSGLSWKDVQGQVCQKARNFYLNWSED